MSQDTCLDMLVPGLLGPIPSLCEIDITPRAVSIERALTRASIRDITPSELPATLFHLFGLSATPSSGLPTAPFSRLADGAKDNDGYWLQASPVHLRPDGDGLLLFDTGVLELTLDDANQLADLVQEHFSDRGWRIEVYDAQRWYLGLEAEPDIQTSALSDVIGRNIDKFLPRGKDAVAWHAMMNEVQMLLYTAKVNMLREGRGQLPINGLWLHGGGSYQPIEQAVYAAVFANDPLARGMSLASGVEPAALLQDGTKLAQERGRQLVVFDLLERSVLNADPYGWVESVELFNAWLEPLLEIVRSKRLGHVDIYPCNGQVYRIDTGSLRRFWRRQKSLVHYLSS
jgi:hypothetical protein